MSDRVLALEFHLHLLAIFLTDIWPLVMQFFSSSFISLGYEKLSLYNCLIQLCELADRDNPGEATAPPLPAEVRGVPLPHGPAEHQPQPAPGGAPLGVHCAHRVRQLVV